MIVPEPTPIPASAPTPPDDAIKSQLFSKKPTSLPAAKAGMSSQEILNVVLAAQQDDVIPWEDAILPSRGIYYGDKIPGGRIQVRAMGLYADKIMATQRLAKSGKSIDWLYRKCVKFPTEFDPLDLLSNDRTFLLYFLRGITHGNEYEFIVECTDSECEEISDQVFDLNALARTIKTPNTDLGPEPFRVVLPHYSSLVGQEFWVHIRFLRGHDIWAMMDLPTTQNKGKKVKKGDNLDETLEQNLNLVITDVMGDKDPKKIKAVVERMHSSDTATINEFLRAHTPGIDTSVKLFCPACKTEMSMDLPITDTFFRPKKPGSA